MNIGVTIDARSFNKWLKSAPEKVERAITNVISKASLLIERESKMRTPVDTGRLRSSIATDLMPLRAIIEPHVKYAIYVHEGTRFMTPRPFMFQGAEVAERQIPALVQGELKKLL